MKKLRYKVGDIVRLVPKNKRDANYAGLYTVRKLQGDDPEYHPYSLLRIGGGVGGDPTKDFYGANESELRKLTKLDKVLL